MCTKNKRGLVKSEYLILIFATVFLSFGLCQNAEPKGFSVSGEARQRKTEHRDVDYDSGASAQRFDSSTWDVSGKNGKTLDEDVKEMISTDTGNSGTKTEAPVMSNEGLVYEDKDDSGIENRHDESIGKTSTTGASTRCGSARGSGKSSCANVKYKKRRRYANFRRGSAVADRDDARSNRIRGSSGRSQRVQERGQGGTRNRGRRRNGKRTRKQESGVRGRSRKYNVTGDTSPAAGASIRDARERRVRDGVSDATKGFTLNETVANSTFADVRENRKNETKFTPSREKDREMMRNVQGNDMTIPGSTTIPEVLHDHRASSDDFSNPPKKGDTGRKRHEENVEHEFSKNLEKEILWSRTEFPDVMDDATSYVSKKKNTSARIDESESSETYSRATSGGVKNSRYDAAKMLGYTRSAEDIPIMDLENEVLARTLDDYNTYLRNGGDTTKLLRHSSTVDGNSRASVSDDTSYPARVHSQSTQRVTVRNDERRKLQSQWEYRQPEVPEGAGNTETTASLAGDLTCINGTFIPAPLARHALIKYVKSSIPGHEYLEADYECVPGFYMASSNSRLLCKNRQWIGALPNCRVRRGQPGPCAVSACDHVCNEVDGRAECSCYKGFRLDGHRCYDVNECESDNGGCEYRCVNTPGSYRCECPQGTKRGENKFTCIDVNECLLNNGHGPCQDTCHNHEGGYTCACEGLKGTILASDNHTCRDTGACTHNNAGCSHTCLSTMGRIFCLCPDGFVLADDWKTCQDVDECYVPDLQTEICHYGCINTPGSYRCVDPTELSDQPIQDSLSITCFPGYELTAGSYCVDINECAVNNGGCSEVCENTDGSFFCTCDGDEKALSVDGISCTDINNLACPPLDPAGRGFLMCSRETAPRMWRDVKREAIRPGTKCYLKCPPGYQLHGDYELTCQGDGTWDGPKHGECVKYSKPRLDCPKDVVAEIPPDRDEAFVTFEQPSTDLDWFRYVRSKPSWGTRLEASLKPGLHLVTFFARHPVSKKQANCVLRIIVKEGEAPKVNNCPSDITGKNGTRFTWTEPIFTDNVRVTRTSNNESPGKLFGIGKWKIVYEASDEAGWTTRCVFSVMVHQD